MPELVFARLDEVFGRTEPDEEIQDLLRASTGLNLALHYLSGATTFDPAVTKLDAALASQIVWLDCLLTNVDRTAKNTNMLMWHKELWLIDHGAALYFHHSWDNWKEQATKPFVRVKNHVLLAGASELKEADRILKAKLTGPVIERMVQLVPDVWLEDVDGQSPAEARDVYRRFLEMRVAASEVFVNEAQDARERIV